MLKSEIRNGKKTSDFFLKYFSNPVGCDGNGNTGLVASDPATIQPLGYGWCSSAAAENMPTTSFVSGRFDYSFQQTFGFLCRIANSLLGHTIDRGDIPHIGWECLLTSTTLVVVANQCATIFEPFDGALGHLSIFEHFLRIECEMVAF